MDTNKGYGIYDIVVNLILIVILYVKIIIIKNYIYTYIHIYKIFCGI